MSDYRKIFILGDTHGDQIDKGAEEVAKHVVDTFKPAIRIHLGDAFDLRWLRSAASDEERRESTIEDIEAGCEFMAWYKPTHWLQGNHDARLIKASTCDTGHLRDQANAYLRQISAALPNGCTVLPYDSRRGALRFGHTTFVHGYSHGETAIKNTLQAYGGSIFMGHVHRTESVPAPSIDPTRPRTGNSVGCLAKLDPSYASPTPAKLKHNHGFAYGYINETTGDCHIINARPIDGEWLLPSDFMRIRATPPVLTQE